MLIPALAPVVITRRVLPLIHRCVVPGLRRFQGPHVARYLFIPPIPFSAPLDAYLGALACGPCVHDTHRRARPCAAAGAVPQPPGGVLVRRESLHGCPAALRLERPRGRGLRTPTPAVLGAGFASRGRSRPRCVIVVRLAPVVQKMMMIEAGAKPSLLCVLLQPTTTYINRENSVTRANDQ